METTSVRFASHLISPIGYRIERQNEGVCPPVNPKFFDLVADIAGLTDIAGRGKLFWASRSGRWVTFEGFQLKRPARLGEISSAEDAEL